MKSTIWRGGKLTTHHLFTDKLFWGVVDGDLYAGFLSTKLGFNTHTEKTPAGETILYHYFPEVAASG